MSNIEKIVLYRETETGEIFVPSGMLATEGFSKILEKLKTEAKPTKTRRGRVASRVRGGITNTKKVAIKIAEGVKSVPELKEKLPKIAHISGLVVNLRKNGRVRGENGSYEITKEGKEYLNDE